MGSPQTTFESYQDLQRYVGWTPTDEQRVAAAAPLVAPCIPELIEDFYAEIQRHPETSRVITGGPQQIDRLKRTLEQWLHELFAGRYDESYVARRWRVGRRHVEIGLPQVYAAAAMSRLHGGLIRVLRRGWQGDESSLAETLQSIRKLVDLDLTVISDAYETEFVNKKQEEAHRRALQAERLAAIGQMATGLAHESRNALQRIGASAEMLELELAGNAAALALVARIQQSQAQLHQLLEDVRNYAAPIVLDRWPCRISEVWREAWELLLAQRHGREAKLIEHIAAADLTIHADRFRLVQVFRNLLDNALAAAADPVRIEITCEEVSLDGTPAFRICLQDNGPGLTAEQRQRIFEPFFTTKPTGTGLGTAIAQRLVEAHGGTIAIGSTTSPGAQLVILLPRQLPT